MTDWLKLVGMIFYAPLRGMREVRDRASLGPLMLWAYGSQVIYVFATQWLAGDKAFLVHPAAIAGNLFQAATSLLPIAIVLIPLIALIANLFDRRGSFSVVMQQEYASLASVTFYALIATNLAAVLIAVFFHFSGFQAAHVANSIQQLPQALGAFRSLGVPAEVLAQWQVQFTNPVAIAGGLFQVVKLALFIVSVVVTVRTVFRASVIRSIAIAILSGGGALMLSQALSGLFHTVLASPLMLLFLFFLLRGYFSGIVRTQPRRAPFKKN